MNNPRQLNYTQQLEHRIALIRQEISRVSEFLDENRMMEAFDKPTKYTGSAWTHIVNIEVACMLDDNESLSWNIN